jgi:hypothetical protein
MTTKTFGRTVLGACAAAVLLAIPMAVSAQAPSVFIVAFERVGPQQIDEDTGLIDPNTGAFDNPCTGELVDVTGSTTISISDTLTQQGDRRVSIATTTKGTGIGQTSFTRYAFSENQQFSVRTPLAGMDFESTFSDRFALKGTKSFDNWVIKATYRLKISASGAILVDVVRLTGTQCKG